ncbi:MAG: response regulator transcription factor [Propionibacteriaceae bacterium]
MTQSDHVLVVDDDDGIREMLQSTLTFAGFRVSAAENAERALAVLTEEDPDAVVLDVMMPGIDGFDFVQLLRLRGDTLPVLFLTARDAVEDRVRGLRLGADDYLTKPFSVVEVTVRLEGLLRRARTPNIRADNRPEGPVLRCADLELDEARHVTRRAGVLVDLSPTEFRLLAYLMLHQGRVLSKAQILDQLWQYDFGGDSNVVERFVSNLRRKIDVLGPPLIHTVRGFGYTIRNSGEPL